MFVSKVGAKVRSQKDRIIKMQKEGIRVLDIADKYHVTESMMYKYLYRWGVEIIRGRSPYQKREPKDNNGNGKKYYNKPMKVSSELLVRRKINQKVNNEKIHFFNDLENARNKSRDARLISNILNKAYM